MAHRTIQWSWYPLIVGLILGTIELVVLVGLDRSGELTMPVAIGTAALSTAIFLVVLLFGRQVVEVDDLAVTTWFGFGWPKRSVPFAEITAIRRVRNRWWYGWGIRAVPSGWMYNTWGYDAVELGLASGRVFRVGTPDPDGLAAAVSAGAGLAVSPSNE